MKYLIVFSLVLSFLNADEIDKNKTFDKKEYEKKHFKKEYENYKEIPKIEKKIKKLDIEISGSITLEHEFN